MTKNPIINAVSAFLYILGLTLFMNWGSKNVAGPDTWVAPLVVISIFTLSAAVMSYIFCLKPVTLYLENKKKEAINLFLQTVLSFGVITSILMLLYFSGIIK